MKKEIILKGSSFILRPYKMNDGESVVKILSNEKVSGGISSKKPYLYTIENFKLFWEQQKSVEKPTYLAIEIKGDFAGSISLDIDNNELATLGYWLDEKYWRKRIITEAIDLIIKYGSENFPIKKIIAEVHDNNPASKKVLINNGFIEDNGGVFVKMLK
jgi:RimJ/RimL family protein N-acetyltransferase